MQILSNRYWYTLILLLFHCHLAQAADTLSSQRELFKQAHQAWLTQQLDRFQQLSVQLSDYPIAHYLRYLYLQSRFDQEPPVTIQAFLQRYPDSPITEQLRQEWLLHLGETSHWDTFLAVYQPRSDTLLQCYYLHAKIQVNSLLTPQEVKEAKQLWLVGQSQPLACNHVFDYLEEQKLLTNDLYWQRIRLALQKDNSSLAGHLAKHLPKTDQKLVTLWQQMLKDPAKNLKTFKQPDTPLSREILLYGLKRLARQEVELAYLYYWQTYQPQYTFTPQDHAELMAYLALQSVNQQHSTAADWLAEVDPNRLSEEIKRAKLQNALRQQDWPAVLKLSQRLSRVDKVDQDSLLWQYWHARALEQTQQLDAAEKLFERLSKQREYYGFLAAERLGKSYQFKSQPLSENPAIQTRLLKKLGIIRARELYLVGLRDYARNEWQAVLSSLTTEELAQAALLAYQWQWYPQAIATLGTAKLWNDLKVRFPLAFYNPVLRNAAAFELKPAWVYAIIRQESAFQEDARSHAGALGLMQLLPKTAESVSTKYNIQLSESKEALFNPELNIQLGTAYLRDLLEQFGNNRLLVTAAYNAGPHRVNAWLSQYPCLPADVWAELIPFKETRDYVQRVMSYTIIFEKHLTTSPSEPLEPMPLDEIHQGKCANSE